MNADPKEFNRLLCWIIEDRVSIRVDDGDLLVSVPGRSLTSEERQRLQRFKRSLVRLYTPITHDNLPWE